MLNDSANPGNVTRQAAARAPRPQPVTKSRDANLLEGEKETEGYAQLIRNVQAGDLHAMETLLMRAQEVAYRFSLLVCGRPDDADDAMQEALLKAYRYAARIREPEAFRA